MSKLSAEEIQKQQKFTLAQSETYKKICKEYESKKYSQALNNLNKILKVIPENGEAIAMKNLILYQTEQQEAKETIEGIKYALRNNLRSATIWHLYGIVCRSEKRYSEALKAFKTMNNLDGKSLFLKRDLYCLQMQNHDYNGALQTRTQMVDMKRDFGGNWICKATSAFCAEKYEIAFQSLNVFMTHFAKKQDDWRWSDLLQFKIIILVEGKMYEKALEFLKKEGQFILDKTFVKEELLKCYFNLQKKNEVKSILKELFKLNPYNELYHSILLELFNIKLGKLNSEESLKELQEFYKEVNFDKSYFVQIEYFCLHSFNEELKKELEGFIDELITLKKTHINTLLNNVFNSEFSIDAESKDQCVLNKLKDLSHAARYCLSYKNIPAKEIQNKSNSILLNYVSMIIQSGNLNEALEYIEIIDKDEFILQKYYWKAKCLAKMGEFKQALKYLELIREKQPYNRNLLNKIIKYSLQCNEIESACNLLKIITSKDENDPSNTNAYLLLAFANAYFLKGDLENAKKYIEQIFSYFNHLQVDLFDFHLYVYEKMSIVAYLDLLRNVENFDNSDLKKKAIELLELINSQ
ncbi:hypothetical protein, conserved [Entamoeba dispar SAW760]|uniref:Tetratricopeptide repeat-containing protein n=1 Tax=Entamoeba dispar (strain ATCC PRA-260 / SAW760) TaxID=370354 RepID=B0EUI3_ENTDS|nr:uncharacterized protein EDI_213290 [Entamoeba dispar SAW760]EDR21814.1 hypothetical protein, conserved [Entamoeba dispar SAW760]|eukprot:EDR21814.1 hypothetical protein, conserved [Entamoeba dispar SAW760]